MRLIGNYGADQCAGDRLDQYRQSVDDVWSADCDREGKQMKKKTWDLYAPIYKRAMKADQSVQSR